MKRKKLFASVVILLLLTAIGWLVFATLNYKTDQNYGWNRTKMDEFNIATALKVYLVTYGLLPSGDIESIQQLLSGENLNGKNPQKIQFLNFKPSIQHSNEMADPWGTPYAINFPSTNSFVISSAGKDKIFSNADDIIFNSVSNDFVKP